MYVALGSFLLAFAALFYAGQIFELQRRDALLFELERRYQEYERLLLAAECLNQYDQALPDKEVETLRAVSGRLRARLMRKSEASLDELLDTRDEVLTVGSDLEVALTQKVMHRRAELLDAGFGNLVAACPFELFLQ